LVVRLHVLRSPFGGGRTSQARSSRLVEQLNGLGHDVVDLTGESPEASSVALRAAVSAESIERLVIAGGDGLVHLAIQEVAQTTIAVTIVPTGTGNDFATALGIQSDVDVDLSAPASPIDLIQVSSADGPLAWVASIAIAGFPASINARANSLSLPIGSHIYAVAAAIELPRFERQQLQLRLDNHPVETDSAMLAIGNTKLFGGGMLACPDARPTDGLLHLTSIEGVGRLGILRHLVGRSGGTADRPEVLRRSCIQIDIDTPNIDIWADGEPIGQTPLSFRVIPQALHLTGIDT
jgi:diacylglycerol kinase (ATP)